MKYIKTTVPQTLLDDNKKANIDVVYSAMHGVGYNYIVEAFKTANLKVRIVHCLLKRGFGGTTPPLQGKCLPKRSPAVNFCRSIN